MSSKGLSEFTAIIKTEEGRELTSQLLEFNLKREKILAAILMILTLCIICIHTLSNNGESLNYVAVKLSISIFILLFGISAIFLILLWKIKSVSDNYTTLKIMHVFLIFTVLDLCALTGVNAFLVNQPPFAYVIAMFGIASVVYLSKIERLILYIGSFVVYLVGIVYLMYNMGFLFSNIVFTGILMMFSVIISDVNFYSYVNNFNQTKLIKIKNEELDRLYKITDETLKIRTEELCAVKEYEELRTSFFTNLSHELRTPINVIFAAEQMLDCSSEHEIKDWYETKLVKYRKIIRQNCFRLLRMVSNLIDITKIDAGHFKMNMKNCDIVMIVQDITYSVAQFIESRGVSLIFSSQIEERVVACDLDKIERIMLNLLSNSVKNTHAGGKITVSIYMKPQNVVIRVKDTGVGIPEEMKDRIFERFVQVDNTTTRNYEGSGIGLSIVKSLVELHGGNINVESEIGVGSEFIIELPDKQINIVEDTNEVVTENDAHYIEKVNVEFSDIYDEEFSHNI